MGPVFVCDDFAVAVSVFGFPDEVAVVELIVVLESVEEGSVVMVFPLASVMVTVALPSSEVIDPPSVVGPPLPGGVVIEPPPGGEVVGPATDGINSMKSSQKTFGDVPLTLVILNSCCPAGSIADSKYVTLGTAEPGSTTGAVYDPTTDPSIS